MIMRIGSSCCMRERTRAKDAEQQQRTSIDKDNGENDRHQSNLQILVCEWRVVAVDTVMRKTNNNNNKEKERRHKKISKLVVELIRRT